MKVKTKISKYFALLEKKAQIRKEKNPKSLQKKGAKNHTKFS